MKRALLVVGAGAAAALLLLKLADKGDNTQDEDILDSMQTNIDVAAGALFGAGPVESMTSSPDMLGMLQRREHLVNVPYNLGDGGWTIGYGHFARSRASLPDYMSDDDAAAQFATDVRDRAEKWVKLYVSVDLTQYQFDALVSVAFNMSPQSFKKFADAVNRGEGIDAIAQASVGWVAAKFTNGIQNRRDAEMAVFNNGSYA